MVVDLVGHPERLFHTTRRARLAADQFSVWLQHMVSFPMCHGCSYMLMKRAAELRSLEQVTDPFVTSCTIRHEATIGKIRKQYSNAPSSTLLLSCSTPSQTRFSATWRMSSTSCRWRFCADLIVSVFNGCSAPCRSPKRSVNTATVPSNPAHASVRLTIRRG